MKKLILFFILLSVITNSYSQKWFDLTVIASPQVSWMTSDSKYINSGKSQLGYDYGVEGDIFLRSDTYLLVTGMTVCGVGGSLVSNKPLPFDGRMLPVGTTVNYYLNDLEFPLALKMRTKNFNRVRYFAQYGLTNWINLRTKATTGDSIFQKQVVKHEIRFYNIGLNIGAGIDYDLGHGNSLTGGLIYADGFSDTTTKARQKNNTQLNVIRLRVGYVF
jgi:hypothetical protein